CFRIYSRSILVKWLKEKHNISIEQTSEELIFIFGTITLMVVLSDVPLYIKEGYMTGFKIMLQKKVTGTFITILQEFLLGKLPSNDNVENFRRKMEIPLKMLELKIDPLTLWYAICTASGIDKLAEMQLSKCEISIKNDNFDPT